jgi:iduronate 2-sulfatase
LLNGSPTEFVDIFPTLAELAGLSVPEQLQGTSLVPILDGSVDEVKAFAVSQWPRAGKMGYALRSGRFRYVAWYDVDEGQIPDGSGKPVAEELFDYEEDPLETVNAVDEGKYAEVTAKFRYAVNAFLKEQLPALGNN